LGVGYFIVCLQQSYVGLEIKNINGQWIVINSNPYGEGALSGIQVGDQILKINHEDAGKYHLLEKRGEAEGASTIEFRRAGQISDSIIIIQKRPALQTILSDFPMYVLGFIFWFLGYMTWFKRPFLVQARTLFWLNWLIALAFVIAHASSRGLLFARELEYFTLSLVPVFLISFVTIFPITNKNRINKTGYLIAIFMFIMIFSLIVLQSLGIVYLMDMLRKLVLADMIIGILFVLWNLGLSMRISKDKPERNQVSIILLGMAVGFLPIILFTAVPIIFNYQQLVYAQVSTLSISIIPISLYYVIVNKYLPDSRRLFIKIISFILIALIISFAVVVTHFLLQVIQTINLEIYLASLFLTILLIAGTYFGYQAISGLLEKYYFQDKNGYRQRIKELKEKINSLFAEDEMIDDLIKSLGIEGVFIIIENPQIGCLRKAGGRFREKQNVQTELEDFFHNDQRLGMEARMLPDDFPAAIYIPFVSHDSTCGIFFGHRTSRIKFVQSDLAFLTLLAGQLAHRLIMAFIIRKLNKESKFVTNINRKLTKENLLLSKKNPEFTSKNPGTSINN
jgi:two-component system sensor histidine kinase ComP